MTAPTTPSAPRIPDPFQAGLRQSQTRIGSLSRARGDAGARRPGRPPSARFPGPCRNVHALAPPSARIEVRANPRCRVHNSLGDFWHALDPVPRNTHSGSPARCPLPSVSQGMLGVVGYRSLDRRCVNFAPSVSTSSIYSNVALLDAQDLLFTVSSPKALSNELPPRARNPTLGRCSILGRWLKSGAGFEPATFGL
jgi:hypothetical protein